MSPEELEALDYHLSRIDIYKRQLAKMSCPCGKSDAEAQKEPCACPWGALTELPEALDMFAALLRSRGAEPRTFTAHDAEAFVRMFEGYNRTDEYHKKVADWINARLAEGGAR